MWERIADMLKVQGEIEEVLLAQGVRADPYAHLLAKQLFDIFMESGIADVEYEKDYKAMNDAMHKREEEE
jgi:hypothetical protein